MAFPNDRTYSFDANSVLSDNAAAYTVSGYMQASGADALLDLGGNQGTSPLQQARIDAVAIFDVTAIKTSSGNESYKLLVVGSNDPNFGAGNVTCLAAVELGAVGGADVVNGLADPIGRVEVGFCTQKCQTLYEFIKCYLVIGGTTPTISISSFVAVLGEP